VVIAMLFFGPPISANKSGRYFFNADLCGIVPLAGRRRIAKNTNRGISSKDIICQQKDVKKRFWQPCKPLRFYFLAISVKKNTSATEIRGDSRAKTEKQ